MGLIARAWLWLTRRVLDGERLGTAGEFVVVEADTERGAIHTLAGTDSDRELVERIIPETDHRERVRWVAGIDADEWAVLRGDPDELLDACCFAAEVDIGDAEALADRLDLPAYQSPVEALRECEDSPRRIYAWEVADDARARSLLEALEAHDVEEMDALHVVLTDREELSQLSYDEIRTYVDAGIETEEAA